MMADDNRISEIRLMLDDGEFSDKESDIIRYLIESLYEEQRTSTNISCGKWRSVNDGLPEEGGRHLCVTKLWGEYCPEIVSFFPDKTPFAPGDEPSHWRYFNGGKAEVEYWKPIGRLPPTDEERSANSEADMMIEIGLALAGHKVT